MQLRKDRTRQHTWVVGRHPLGFHRAAMPLLKATDIINFDQEARSSVTFAIAR
jgi:hypothetical protein